MKLQIYRHQIESIDKSLVKLLSRRFKVSQKIGFYKAAKDLDVYFKDQETRVKKKLENLSVKYGLDYKFLSTLWDQIMSESIKAQEKIINNKKQ